MDHNLTRIDYSHGSSLQSVTFVFNDGTISPPKDKYWDNPEDKCVLPADKRIKMIVFGFDNEELPYMVSVQVFNSDKKNAEPFS